MMGLFVIIVNGITKSSISDVAAVLDPPLSSPFSEIQSCIKQSTLKAAMKNHRQYKRNLSLNDKIIKNSLRNCNALIWEIERLVQIIVNFSGLILHEHQC